MCARQWIRPVHHLQRFLKNINKKRYADEWKLIEPLSVELADSSATMKINAIVFLDMTFYTKSGEVTARKIGCYVTDSPMREPIIGNSVLISLGIDPKSNLERYCSNSTNLNVEISTSSEAIEDECDHSVDIGHCEDSELERSLHEMIARARQAGLPRKYWSQLTDLVSEFKSIFRVKLMKDAPADVTPMDVHLVPNPSYRNWGNRKYTDEELSWLKEHITKLEEHGYIKRNPHARWASPVMVVPKPHNRGFRMVVDVKFANDQVIKTHWPMPHMELVLKKLKKAKCFALLDAFKGYWLFPVTRRCAELYSIKTPFGVFTPTRIIQGAADAVKYFQAGMEEALDMNRHDDCLLWVDDILAHATDCESHLMSLRRIFDCCKQRRIKLSATKCDLYMTKVTWCGREISERGVSFDPEYVRGLQEMPEPNTVADVQQWVCSLNWMRSSIPNFSRHIGPLQEKLKLLIQKIGSSKSQVLKRRKLTKFPEIWNMHARLSYKLSKLTLEKSIRLAHLRDDEELCVFSDASEKHWGLFVTQIPTEQLRLPYDKQDHRPLMMLSGQFKSNQMNWHIKEKEAYPVIVALRKLRHMLKRSKGFRLFIDHKNLVHIFSPSSRSGCAKHADDRVTRWALLLLGFRFQVEHIPGEHNVVADLLSRWGASHSPMRARSLRFAPGIVNPLQKDEFKWPKLQDIARMQRSTLHSQPDVKPGGLRTDVMNGVRLLSRKDGRIWVPTEDLRVRICVIAHAGSSGHRGIDITASRIKKHFYWKYMNKDIDLFCKNCLHCRVSGDSMIPRPLGEAIHGSKRGEVLHYDYLNVGPSSDEYEHVYKYVLVIKDDFSGFVELVPCSNADSSHVVKALLYWYSRYGVSTMHVSDQGSHFKNNVVAELNRLMQTRHHFTHAYTPFANGTVEIVNKEIRRLFRVWSSEFRLPTTNWPNYLPLIQHVINFTRSTIHGYAPAYVFGGFESQQPLDVIFHSKLSEYRQSMLSSEEIQAQIAGFRRSLRHIHRKVTENDKSRRGRHRHNDKRQKVNFGVGDYVMFATRRGLIHKKSKPRWTGPYKIVKVNSEWDFEIQHLISKEVSHAHATRLSFYCDSSLNVTPDFKHQIAHDESNLTYQVESILAHDDSTGEYRFQIHWIVIVIRVYSTMKRK